MPYAAPVVESCVGKSKESIKVKVYKQTENPRDYQNMKSNRKGAEKYM